VVLVKETEDDFANMDYCEHTIEINNVGPGSEGCEECLEMNGRWVHLRLCMTCGHVGCCDSSPNRHATGHFDLTSHPMIRSFEPGETWAYCYLDERFFETAPTPG
jgi:uncharacterized UBP type Zn finger protein